MTEYNDHSNRLKSFQNQKGFIHPKFGNLNHKNAVVLNREIAKGYVVAETTPFYFHLSVTGRCFAKCQGCVNAAVTASFDGNRKDLVPIEDTKPERDATCILNLAKENGSGDVVVCFYGGEPLMAVEKINRVYQVLSRSDLKDQFKYMLYTSGDLLTTALCKFPELIRNIWLFAVSIDGSQQQHELFRAGTSLVKIHEGLAEIKNARRGTVLMWSTLRENQSLLNCFEEFIYLKEKGLADQFFWHWIEAEAPFHAFDQYLVCYEKELILIMDSYLRSLGNGDVLPIVHINELIIYILTGKERNASACGVELAGNYDLIDGKIHSCADLPPELAIGHIDDDGNPVVNRADLTFLTEYKEDMGCYACGVHSYCGGRCPVQAITSGFARMRQYCQLMRLHVGIVKACIDDVVLAMKHNDIALQDLYNESAFYAQFTDVTP